MAALGQQIGGSRAGCSSLQGHAHLLACKHGCANGPSKCCRSAFGCSAGHAWAPVTVPLQAEASAWCHHGVAPVPRIGRAGASDSQPPGSRCALPWASALLWKVLLSMPPLQADTRPLAWHGSAVVIRCVCFVGRVTTSWVLTDTLWHTGCGAPWILEDGLHRAGHNSNTRSAPLAACGTPTASRAHASELMTCPMDRCCSSTQQLQVVAAPSGLLVLRAEGRRR